MGAVSHDVAASVLLGCLAFAALADAPARARADADPASPPPPLGSDSVKTVDADGNATIVPIAQFAVPELNECSGIVRRGGLWFAHNDSGDAPRLFVSERPDFLEAQPLVVPGAVAVDWETVTLIDGDLLVCDVGDNRRSRSDVTLYRVRYHPAVNQGSDAGAQARHEPARLELLAAYPVAYPDGPHDCEAVFVTGGHVHLVVKNRGEPRTTVMRLDTLLTARELPPDRRNVAVVTGAIELPAGEQVTDAAVHEGRGLLALLSYGAIFVYPLDKVAGPPARTVRLFARQCEALTFDGDDAVFANEERDVFRVPDFFRRELRSMLPPAVKFFVRRMDPATTALPGGLPEVETPLSRVPLESNFASDVLRMGVCGDRLLMDGWLEFDDGAGAGVPTNQQSTRLGTAVLFVAPRSADALMLADDEAQYALVLREDFSATLLRVNLAGGRERPELVPGARVAGGIREGRFVFRLSLPLSRLSLAKDATSFRFNACTLGMRTKTPEAVLSGGSVFALLRPEIAAVAEVAEHAPVAPPATQDASGDAGGKDE